MKNLVDELKNYNSICFYPSCGTDMSDIDYFCSGCLPREERIKPSVFAEDWKKDCIEPDVFIHSDVNFYMEFEAGEDLELEDCGIHSCYEILEFEQLESIKEPNRINNNTPFSGNIFKYKLKVWGKEKPVTLIFCLCENEFVVSQIFLANKIFVNYIWSKNWNGGLTYGTWLAKVANILKVRYFYTDWLCLPGFRGEPSNNKVYDKYPELETKQSATLERTNNHWIEEGSHGWVDEFRVK